MGVADVQNTMDLLTYWNLRERPFEATWDTRFFYRSHDHDEALNRLTFLVEEKTMNLGMLTGEVGCGKTLTRAVFARRLDPARFTVITQENSAFAFKDLIGSVLELLDPTGKGQSKYARCERLKKAAQQVHSENRHLVLIFDEAQEMSPATMNELKMLTNLNGDGVNVLTMVLLGQPELRAKVAKLPPIDQRISLRFHLHALTLSECAEYVRHRLKTAGHLTGELYPPDSIGKLFQASKGIPRELNRLAKLALEYAWLCEMPCVTGIAVDAIVRDLSRHQNLFAA